MKYTQIPTTAFEQIQLNAGILVDDFNPKTGVIGRILGATSGGVNFTDAPEYTDYGEDIDNCPKNMLELKKLNKHEVTMSGTFITMDAQTAQTLAGAAVIDPNDNTHIIPMNDLKKTDFKSIWWIGDYSDVNTGDNAGFIAIHMMNALNTGGFQIQSGDNAKGQFAFTFTGHYSMDAQTTVPYEIFIKKGDAEEVPSVSLNTHFAEVDEEGTVTLTAVTVPESATVTWTSGDENVATVSNGEVLGIAEGNTVITASITIDGILYNDTCTIVVNAI